MQLEWDLSSWTKCRYLLFIYVIRYTRVQYVSITTAQFTTLYNYDAATETICSMFSCCAARATSNWRRLIYKSHMNIICKHIYVYIQVVISAVCTFIFAVCAKRICWVRSFRIEYRALLSQYTGILYHNSQGQIGAIFHAMRNDFNVYFY